MPVEHSSLHPHASAEHHARFDQLQHKFSLARGRGGHAASPDPEVGLLRAHRVDRDHLYELARYKAPADFAEGLRDTARRRARGRAGAGAIGGVAAVGLGGFWGARGLRRWCRKHHKKDGVCKVPKALHM